MIVKPIERLFYKKYAYKATLNVSWRDIQQSHLDKPTTPKSKEAKKIRVALDKWTQQEFGEKFNNLTAKKELGFKTRIELKYNFFFETKQLADSFVKHVEQHIETFYEPLNESHEELILDDYKNRIRNSLFDRKYRYKLTFCRPRVGKISIPKDWCEEYFGSKGLSLGSDRWLYKVNWRSEVLYLNEKKDVMAARLGLSEYIQSIEFCVLVDEIEEK